MSLYAIGDLHLHFQSELKAPSQLTEPIWQNHEQRFLENCRKMITSEDTLVLVGDHSWGRKLSECEKDLEYIQDLPGRKILIRGNHDMFWDSGKTRRLNELYAGKLEFLQGNYYAYGNYALVGTKGYCFEGPFYVNRQGRVIGWDRSEEEKAAKLVERELDRLEDSFLAAKADGFSQFIMFLHYPPTSILEKSSGFTKLAEKFGAEQVIYAHCHGERHFHERIQGIRKGIRYSLVSGDFLRWRPMKIL